MISIKDIKHSAGVTLIELAVAMTIASIATLGVGAGITTIVGFYQDDWVTKEVRFWGYEATEFIVNHFETAKKVDVLIPWNNYDGLRITQAAGLPILNIQGSKKKGLMKDGDPLLDHVKFPSSGVYRSSGQRLIELERFTIDPIDEYSEYRSDFEGKPYLDKLKDSLFIMEMVISVTTQYQGEEAVEYIKFKRTVWARDKYFKS